MNPRNEFYNTAFSEWGNGLDILVFRGVSRYQYGQGVGDVLRGRLQFYPTVARFLKPVAINIAQTLLKFGSEAIKDGVTFKDVTKSMLTSRVGTVLGATVDEVAFKLIQMRDNNDAAPPPNPPIVVPESVQAGSGRKRRRAPVYQRRPNVSSIHPFSKQLIIIFKMASIGGDVTEEITSEVDLFNSIMM